MPCYGMQQLSDFVQLGPQVVPEDRPNAVQVIERGPHGARLSADPVYLRANAPRGSGFRFWKETAVKAPWEPQQEVVGLWGLSGSAEPSNSDKTRLSQRAVALLQKSVSATSSSDLNDIITQANAGVEEADSYQQWDEPSTWEKYWNNADWDNKTQVKINFREAKVNASRKLAGQQARTTTPVRHMNVWTETAKNTPSAIVERTHELQGKGPGLCSKEFLDVPLIGKVVCEGVGKPRSGYDYMKYLMIAGGIGVGLLAVYGVSSGLGRGLASRGK